MKKISQFGIILVILLASEILQKHFSLSVPATIIGMIILLALLLLKVIKIAWVEDISNVLLDNLSLLFIPAGVAIINEFQILKDNIIPIISIIIITTVIVILVTGYTVQALIGNKNR